MKAHIVRNTSTIKQWKVFHAGDEFQITKYVNVKNIPDNKSFFVYKKIGYQTYEGFNPYKHKTLNDAKASIRKRGINGTS